ncbi:hypothetical protein [Sphingomonas aurantiaca]|uniref:hypothetical protein n=1 Tax=Sphingomonas aurantiaca TaxID=185949 RepID=UPI003364947D
MSAYMAVITPAILASRQSSSVTVVWRTSRLVASDTITASCAMVMASVAAAA